MGTINDRIKRIVNELFNGNTSSFARQINVPQPTLKDIVGGKLSTPRADVLEKIFGDKSLNISAEWLLGGEGEMIKNISENSENNLKQTSPEERNMESTNENQDVPMSEILEFMKLVSSNMDNQLKSFHLQMSEQRVEMREQRIAMMAELKEQRLAMVEQFTKLYTLMDKQFTEVAKRNEAESKILQAMVNKIAQADEKTGRIIQLQKVSGD